MNYIKTNNKWSRQRGTTLIELSVVIAVILLLVGVLFIGVQAWRDGANKAACLVNQSTIQKAVRGYQNMNQAAEGATVAMDDLKTAGFWGVNPTCPQGAAIYVVTGTIPPVGTPYVTSCPNGHAPLNTNNW